MAKNNLTHVAKALRSESVSDLFIKVLHTTYFRYFGSHKTEIKTFLSECIEGLRSTQTQSLHPTRLVYESMKWNFREIKKRKKWAWLTSAYDDYRLKKIQYEYSVIRTHIKGSEILDFGCGDGRFASMLSKKGYKVWGTDVSDVVVNSLRETFIFDQMNRKNPTIPFQKNTFDTVIVKSVLHHITKGKFSKTLLRLRKCTKKRLILKEDVFDIDRVTIGKHSKTLTKQQMMYANQFVTLSQQEQIQYLSLMDFYGNVVVQGMGDMPLPFNFNSLKDWTKLLRQHGFYVRKIIYDLFNPKMLHTGPHVWIICE